MRLLLVKKYEEINNWLNKFRYVPIIIDATFGKKDTAHAEITLDNFLVSSLVIKDDITEQLEKMAKEMVRSNGKRPKMTYCLKP